MTSPGYPIFLSWRIAINEVNAVLCMRYNLMLLVYELSRRMLFEWKISLPNPTPPETDEPETSGLEPEA